MTVISKEAMEAIRSAATQHFRQTGTKLPDGTYDVPLDDEVLERLEEHRLPGETISDTIIRAIAVMTGKVS